MIDSTGGREALKGLPWVEDALVFGVTDERFGQKVAGVLSCVPGTYRPAEDILAGLRQKLAAYKVPREVVVVDEVPRTQVSSWRRPVLTRRGSGGPSVGSASRARRQETSIEPGICRELFRPGGVQSM